jgi:hypothetical protein
LTWYHGAAAGYIVGEVAETEADTDTDTEAERPNFLLGSDAIVLQGRLWMRTFVGNLLLMRSAHYE